MLLSTLKKFIMIDWIRKLEYLLPQSLFAAHKEFHQALQPVPIPNQDNPVTPLQNIACRPIKSGGIHP